MVAMTKLIIFMLIAVLNIWAVIYRHVPALIRDKGDIWAWICLSVQLAGLFSCGVVIGGFRC